jgi:DMSO/TMAO reductase YedYZ heme-binding membrane subunit
VLLRRKVEAYWRYFHALMYVALFFGVVHANLWGRDFENGFIVVIYDGLFAVALVAFVLKRWQFHKIKQKRNHANNHPPVVSEQVRTA